MTGAVGRAALGRENGRGSAGRATALPGREGGSGYLQSNTFFCKKKLGRVPS
jgi:hypothetical protein